jgi:DNA-binding LytR/AlgR family response regulator
LTAYLLFAGCLLLLDIVPLGERLAWGWLAAAAALVSLPFFTLSVTMLDLLLGLPELGLHGFGFDGGPVAAYAASDMAARFAMESLYHLDNHLALCALIVLPRLLLSSYREAAPAAEAGDTQIAPAATGAAPVLLHPKAPNQPAVSSALLFLERFEPPMKGAVLAVQAQEHYVRVVTSEGAGCTLYRFGDALRELEGVSGLQVHRSFWVADAGVAAIRNGRRGMKILLRNGEEVPVSAKHADLVQRRYSERLEPVA